MVQHIGKEQRERLVADDVTGAPHRMSETERGLLPREARLTRNRQVGHQRFQLSCLFALRKRPLQFVLNVEVILDDSLVAPRHEHEVLDAGRPRFIDHVLDDGPIHHSQHFLRDCLCGGQEPRAETCHGEHGFADTGW